MSMEPESEWVGEDAPLSATEEEKQLLMPICKADESQLGYNLAHQTFADRYLLMHGIGSGKYGKVYEGRDLAKPPSESAVAVKVMPRMNLSEAEQDKAEREWKIAAKLNHPNVIRLLDVQISDSSIFLVLELASGRALFDLVSESGGFEEEPARQMFSQIHSGVAYCHHMGVYHRDLKLENLLVANDVVKITDFGLSKDSTMSDCRTLCGTLSYMAPEVAQSQGGEGYEGALADIWSMGVVLYVMRCCSYPFGHDGRGQGAENFATILKRIKSAQLKELQKFQRQCSPQLQALIMGMLKRDPADRLSMEQIRQSEWLAGEPQLPQSVQPAASAAIELQVNWTPMQAPVVAHDASEPNDAFDHDILNEDGSLCLPSDSMDTFDMPLSYECTTPRDHAQPLALGQGLASANMSVESNDLSTPRAPAPSRGAAEDESWVSNAVQWVGGVMRSATEVVDVGAGQSSAAEAEESSGPSSLGLGFSVP